MNSAQMLPDFQVFMRKIRYGKRIWQICARCIIELSVTFHITDDIPSLFSPSELSSDCRQDKLNVKYYNVSPQYFSINISITLAS